MSRTKLSDHLNAAAADIVPIPVATVAVAVAAVAVLLWLLRRLLQMLLLATAAAEAAALRWKDVHEQCLCSPVEGEGRTMTRPSGDQPDIGSAKRR